MLPKKNRTRLSIITVLLVVAASTGLVSAAMTAGTLPGFERFNLGIYWHSPTATYQGSLNTPYNGTYHYVSAVPVCRNSFPPCLDSNEALFYLTLRNQTIRLIFYCPISSDNYCTDPKQLPFHEGDCVYVKGTQIAPSTWPKDRYSPELMFQDDLYVFHYASLANSSCS